MAGRKTAPKAKQSESQANPRNLAPQNAAKVKGGLSVKLENARITSYQIG